MSELRAQALRILCLSVPGEKATAARALHAQALTGTVALQPERSLARPEGLPGRPEHPRLVPTLQAPKRSPFTREGRAALIHAIAHIEFNAIKACLHIGTKSTRSTPGLIHANRLQLTPCTCCFVT